METTTTSPTRVEIDAPLSQKAAAFIEAIKIVKEANNGWIPDFERDDQDKYELRINTVTKNYLAVRYDGHTNFFSVPVLLFKSREVAMKAGEEHYDVFEKAFKYE